MKYKYIVIHFGEIWLKGKNRGTFVKRLYSNITDSLRSEKYERLENARDRFILHLNSNSDVDSILGRLDHVFGISWFAPVVISGNKISEIIKSASGMFDKSDKVQIIAHRSYKGLDYDSRKLVGTFIKQQKRIPFTLDIDGEKKLYINVRREDALLYRDKSRGLGGLPVGVSGKAVVLLSGGIDSPLASYYAMKKGLSPIYIHVHAFPKNEEAVESKMKELVSRLSDYSPRSRVYYVPSYLFQAAVIKVNKKYELVLFKRFLYKLAESIAKREDAKVLVTGESLGQVASQTVENLISSERGIKLLAVRPLIGMDKQEIIDLAKRLGTYDISVKSYPDVCSLRAKNPSTATEYSVINKIYNQSKLNGVLSRSLKKAKLIDLGR